MLRRGRREVAREKIDASTHPAAVRTGPQIFGLCQFFECVVELASVNG